MHNNQSTMTAQQRQVYQDVVETVRVLMQKTNTLNASTDVLNSFNQQLKQCVDFINPSISNDSRALEYYNLDYGDDINKLQPYSPFIGTHNPLAPPLNCRSEKNKVIGEVNFSVIYEGPPDCCHGGVISGIYDQLLALPGTLQGKAGSTAYLHVDFKKPTPLYKTIRFEAWVDRVEGKKIFAHGRCFDEDILLSEAEALFINSYSE